MAESKQYKNIEEIRAGNGGGDHQDMSIRNEFFIDPSLYGEPNGGEKLPVFNLPTSLNPYLLSAVSQPKPELPKNGPFFNKIRTEPLPPSIPRHVATLPDGTQLWKTLFGNIFFDPNKKMKFPGGDTSEG